MKIIELRAENVKRLKAVHIKPDGTLQVVTGRNAQGKSSVLDSIWLALGGGAAMRDTAKPVRDGEDSASVTLDLGDLVVTRKWSGERTSLEVKGADGRKYGSPQGVLDDLVGRLSFDPLAFTRLKASEQVSALLELVDLEVDLDAMAADRQRLYDERTEIGRQGKALGDVPAVDKSLPEAEQSASELLATIREAQDAARAKDSARAQHEEWANGTARIEREIARLQDELKTRKATGDARYKAWRDLPDAPDTAALEADLANVEQTNAAIRANNLARDRAEQKAKLTEDYNAHTKAIDALDSKRSKALAAAEFPVPGLGFDDDGVTYQGVPFSQASAAEQIKVSLGMAMALNPELRVVRIMDGSLLDAESMEAIAKMATDADYQVLIERVDDPSEAAILIEDGTVVSR